jgi:hypothetical protein
MRISTGMIILCATAAAATAAVAQPKASDAQYMQASRCAGLASSANLGGADAAGYDGWLKANGEGRSTFVTDRAVQMRKTAKMQGNRASGLEKQQLTSELGGACANYKG